MTTPELDYQQSICGDRWQHFSIYRVLTQNGLAEIKTESLFGPHVYILYLREDYVCLWVPSHYTFAGQGRRRVAEARYYLARRLMGDARGGQLELLYCLRPGAHFMRCRWQMLRWLDTQQGLANAAKRV